MFTCFIHNIAVLHNITPVEMIKSGLNMTNIKVKTTFQTFRLWEVLIVTFHPPDLTTISLTSCPTVKGSHPPSAAGVNCPNFILSDNCAAFVFTISVHRGNYQLLRACTDPTHTQTHTPSLYSHWDHPGTRGDYFNIFGLRQRSPTAATHHHHHHHHLHSLAD